MLDNDVANKQITKPNPKYGSSVLEFIIDAGLKNAFLCSFFLIAVWFYMSVILIDAPVTTELDGTEAGQGDQRQNCEQDERKWAGRLKSQQMNVMVD